jgi:Flp pilus assembly protein TadG
MQMTGPRTLTKRLAARARAFADRYSHSTDGVAALEFALIVPIMFFMFVGAIEMSQAITVDRRVSQVASSTADLIARAEKEIQENEVNDIMKIGGYILKPYAEGPVIITVRNVTSSPTNALDTKETWRCVYSGLTKSQTCSCVNQTFNIPAGLVGTNDSVVVSEATYDYRPLIYDYFLSRRMTSGPAGPGTYRFSERIHLKPRSQAAKLKFANGTTC